MFSRTKSFCFENKLFYSHISLGMCEGVGEDSGHGIGHVDIRVGSCNCLNVFVLPCLCTLVGSNSGRKLSLLGFAHPVEGSPFQVQGAIGKAALIRGHLRRKMTCGFDIIV